MPFQRFMHESWAPPHYRVSAEDIKTTAKELGLKIHWGEDIQPGDLYLAGRNAGVKLLTCKRVNPRNWVESTTSDYPYDCHECVKVSELSR